MKYARKRNSTFSQFAIHSCFSNWSEIEKTKVTERLLFDELLRNTSASTDNFLAFPEMNK